MPQDRMNAPHAIRIGREGAPWVVFGHGWGRTHRDFIPVAEMLAPIAQSLLIDLPGFGGTPRPDDDWGTDDYAAYLAEHLSLTHGIERFVWVGHSFGGRVGLRMAAMPVAGLKHLVIVAGAGVPRKRSTWEEIRAKFRSAQFRRLKAQARDEEELISLEKRFGSADYIASRTAGLRDIFLRTVAENQTKSARAIAVPTTLIYGGRDTETPPEIGRRLHRLIKGSDYIECPDFGHISILDRGRNQIALTVKEALGLV
ncbi:MAG: alpha/beta fold hydrolase [Pseudomonadota bacterium]